MYVFNSAILISILNICSLFGCTVLMLYLLRYYHVCIAFSAEFLFNSLIKYKHLTIVCYLICCLAESAIHLIFKVQSMFCESGNGVKKWSVFNLFSHVSVVVLSYFLVTLKEIARFPILKTARQNWRHSSKFTL